MFEFFPLKMTHSRAFWHTACNITMLSPQTERICLAIWPWGMSANMHMQWEGVTFSHLENVVKCFCALVILSKVAVDEVFYASFSKHVVSFWGFRPYPHQGSASRLRWGGDSVPRASSVPIPGKNPAVAHAMLVQLHPLHPFWLRLCEILLLQHCNFSHEF